jgi:hypothetical protein
VVTACDIEKSLKKQMKIATRLCTWLKIKFDRYASFHVPVAQNNFRLKINSGGWHTGCLTAPFYGRLRADRTYSVGSF